MKAKIQIDDRYKAKLAIKKNVKDIAEILLSQDEIKASYALNGFEFNQIAFDIVLTDDAEIHQINKEYRKKDAPTDVITFALFADDDNKFVFNKTIELGEIFVSIDTAKKQAEVKTKEGLKKEVLTLIAHGILHLLGFDHKTDKDYNFIVRIQNGVIKKIYEKVSI